MEKEKKRLFFGMEVHAPWPKVWPKGRLIDEGNRHLTLAFLGSVSYPDIEVALFDFPKPQFLIAPCGWFDAALLLPKKRPHVAAWHAKWLDDDILHYQRQLAEWLKEKKFHLEDRQWLSHVTVCRDPEDGSEWTKWFSPLPCFAGSVHLYESLGYSKYQTLFSSSLVAPFEEIEHTADIAFNIYGIDLKGIYRNAFFALSFKYPGFLTCWEESSAPSTLDDAVVLLNNAVSRMDRLQGCPFKAVSFHGEIQPYQNNLLQWEMIVDV